MAFAPTASAQVGVTMPEQSYGYASVAPTLIGVGQQLTCNVWIAPLPSGYSGSPWYGPGPVGYTGLSVTFTRPDGTTDTYMPTDPTGNYIAGETEVLGTLVFDYTPNMAGNWSLTVSMPPQNLTDASGTVLVTSCTSPPCYFTVQTAAVNAGIINGWPYSPLPNSNVYWTYPVSANNREWASIAAPMWPASSGVFSDYQPYGSAPSTSHIVWDMQGADGGIIGGDMCGVSYESNGPTPIIFEGFAYFSGMNNLGGTTCYSLTTGKLMWTSNNTVTKVWIAPGNPYSQATEETQASGVVLEGSTAPTPYLFGTSTGPTIKGVATTNWNYINPWTGLVTKQITNATMGTGTWIGDNSPLVYGQVLSGQVTFSPYYMKVNYVWGWNYSKVASTNDWYTGLMWTQNVTNHWERINGVLQDQTGPGDGIGRTQGFSVSADGTAIAIGGSAGNFMLEGFSTKDGHSIWNDSLGYVGLSSSNGQLQGTNDILTFSRSQEEFQCYSIDTGALLWTSTNSGINDWDTQSYNHVSDANNVYIPSIDGTVDALNLATGKVVWKSTPIPSTEMIFNCLPCYGTPIVAGGFVYEYCGYATAYEQEPIPRFSVCECLNATTGATVWILQGGNNPTAEAGGYLFTNNPLMGIVSCIGKGQTSTSVSVQNNVISKGNNVLITGNVLDQSPAQSGTPAVSDSCMSEWMDYLHFQNATLLNSGYTPTGVSVTLTALDPNNNTENIGTYTTNGKGNFYVDWTPPVPGQYTITASFAGTNSYWPSTAETGIVVNAATATTTTSTTVTTSSGVSTAAIYAIGAAIIVVIIVVAIVLALLMLRKRP